VCETLGIPLWCSALEADNMESGDLLPLVRDLPGYRDGVRSLLGPPHPVARRLSEGDEVGGFVVVETPGHTPGHISFWRETDGVLIAGDVLKSWDFVTGETGLSEPRDEFTLDPTSNRHSILKLAQLEPRLICVGHGAPVAGSTELQRLAAGFQS
jgi:glyoxylase-like metal-dependent hydrolase (beta-lactamase superfamily II)